MNAARPHPTRRSEIRRTAALLALLAGVAGCGRGERESESAADALQRFHAAAPSAGRSEEGGMHAELGHVLAARVTASGEHFVALDLSPPFVRVFHRDGRLRSAFLERGGGPGEARAALAVATSGDSALLVADAVGRVTRFDLDGRRLGEGAKPGFPVAVLAEACGGWVAYGPRRAGTARNAHWLHRARTTPGAPAEWTDAFEDTFPRQFGVGIAYGMVSTPGGVVARHQRDRRFTVVGWSCDAPAPRAIHAAPFEDAPSDARRVPGGVAASIGPGNRSLGGMAEHPDGVIWADLVYGEGNTVTTEWTLRRPDGRETTVKLPGRWILNDSRRGVGILVGGEEPVPHVFLLTEAQVREIFARG